jgi:hypothetical protein
MSIVGSTCPTIPVKPRLCIVQRGAAFFDCSLDRCAGRGPMRYALRILQRALSTRPRAFPSNTNLPIASYLSLEAIRPQIAAGRRRKSRHRSERRNAAAHACRHDRPAIRSTSARRHERSARAIAAESRRGESSRSSGQEHGQDDPVGGAQPKIVFEDAARQCPDEEWARQREDPDQSMEAPWPARASRGAPQQTRDCASRVERADPGARAGSALRAGTRPSAAA